MGQNFRNIPVISWLIIIVYCKANFIVFVLALAIDNDCHLVERCTKIRAVFARYVAPLALVEVPERRSAAFRLNLSSCFRPCKTLSMCKVSSKIR